uniref:Synaptic plasticity regulator PANTS n=1 Tax=Denticeps clupeoides TaxID=299321 RepID=A0AAY4E0Q3_9TELE
RHVGSGGPPRVCDDYWSEFRHCRSVRNRFHHFYTFGTSPSCQQWKEDFNSCRAWEKSRSPEAKESLQKSERGRVAEQRNFTPVWELRQHPPRDWHLPLDHGNPPDS